MGIAHMLEKIVAVTINQISLIEVIILGIVGVLCILLEKRHLKRDIPFRLLFSVFIVVYVTLLRRHEEISLIRLIPFQIVSWGTLYTDALNIFLFVPFGYETARRMKRVSFPIVLLEGAVFSFIIECLQMALSRGVCETQDVIFNTVGAMVGLALYYVVRKCIPK